MIYRFVKLGLLVALIEFTIGALLTPYEYVERIILEEEKAIYYWYGDDVVSHNISETNQQFRRTFIASGVVDSSYIYFEQKEPSSFADELTNKIYYWVTFRLDVFWRYSQNIVRRMVLLLHWLPFYVIVVGTFVVDGLARRSLKRASYGHTSTNSFNVATRTLLLLLIFPLAYVFFPAYLTPIFPTLWVMVVSIVTGFLLANIQKYI